jgi:hypothetical protein
MVGRYVPLGQRAQEGNGMGGRYLPLGERSDGPGLGPSRLPQNDVMDLDFDYGRDSERGTMGQPSANMEPGTHDCTCGNCSREGHRLKVCVGPVDSYGYIPGCPEHNTKEHAMGDCPVLKNRPSRLVHYLKLRHCKPPLAGSVDPRFYEIPHGETLEGVRPWTPQWALEMQNNDPSYWLRHEYRPFPDEENPEDPAWECGLGVPEMTDPRGPAGHLWKEKNRGSQERDRDLRNYRPRDNRRRSRSRDRRRSRSSGERKRRSRRRSRSWEERRSRYRSRSRSRDRRSSRSSYRRRSRSPEDRGNRGSRSTSRRGYSSRQYSGHRNSREVGYSYRPVSNNYPNANIQPPRVVTGQGMGAKPVLPQVHGVQLQNNTATKMEEAGIGFIKAKPDEY